ncbi:MAG: phytanoyl-CoA dioxygenase family protein [Pseudomonadota bacterium]
MTENLNTLKGQNDADGYVVVEDVFPPALLARLQHETRSAIHRVAARWQRALRPRQAQFQTAERWCHGCAAPGPGVLPAERDAILAVGILVEDCTPENVPPTVVPCSLTGPVHDQHHNGHVVDGINADHIRDEIQRAVPLRATAGSITVHPVRTLHASTANRSAVNPPAVAVQLRCCRRLSGVPQRRLG